MKDSHARAGVDTEQGWGGESGSFPATAWLLEAGSRRWEDVGEAVDSCLDDLVAGGVLEVISWVPGIEADMATWATRAGHHLIRVLPEGGAVRV